MKVCNATWKNVMLSDIIEIISGGTPKTNVPDYWGGHIPWLSVADFNNGFRWVSKAEKAITEQGLNHSATEVLNRGDIIISARGTVGVVAQLAMPMAFNQSCYGIRGKNNISATDFIHYMLRDIVLTMKRVSHGAVFETITQDTFKIIETRLPPLPEQLAIAHILGTLDDKIELNRKMNETLEAIAKAIFKSWFVDFDPVRAKMEGQEPAGMDAETAALFPDGFEESELGEIPRGWKVDAVDKIINILSGGTPKTSISEYWDGDIPWFTPKDSPPSAQVFVIDTERHITELGVEKSATQVLPAGTTIITARGTVGKLALTGVPMAMNQTCYGIKGREGYSDYYIYYCLNNLLNELKQKTHGTVFETITTDTFKTIISIIPPAKLTVIYHNQIQDFINEIKINLFESRTLAQIRDALLPKLLSGEIRVGEAEKVVESAV